MKYGLPLPERKQKFNELAANQANVINQFPIPTVNGNKFYPVYYVSVELPKYRLDNTRTLALQEKYLQDENKPDDFFSDLESDEVQKVQHSFLKKLAESPDKEKDLYTYFSKNTQNEPLILTHDGFVISGNRRLSTFRELLEKDYAGYKTFSDVMVVILPNLDADKIDQIEDILEQQKDIKEPFSWVARALGYRRRMQRYNYSHDDLAKITGQKPNEINMLINKLDIADRYLDSIGKPRDYNQVLDDLFAFNKIYACLNNGRDRNDHSRRIAFEKLSFLAIKNKNDFADRMYKNIPVIYDAQVAIQNEIAGEFEEEIKVIEAQKGQSNPIGGLPLFPNPTVSIIKLMENPAYEKKIVEIVSDKIEEQMILEREKKKKSSVFDKVKKAHTLLVEANLLTRTGMDKNGILLQLNNLENEISKLKAWINQK